MRHAHTIFHSFLHSIYGNKAILKEFMDVFIRPTHRKTKWNPRHFYFVKFEIWKQILLIIKSFNIIITKNYSFTTLFSSHSKDRKWSWKKLYLQRQEMTLSLCKLPVFYFQDDQWNSSLHSTSEFFCNCLIHGK